MIASDYDALIFDPVLREYFGPRGYYNVGRWAGNVQTQEEACDQLVETLVAPVPVPSRALDVACGLGATTRQLRALWPSTRILGVNWSAAQVAWGARRGGGVRFAAGDAAELPVRTESCDALVSIEAPFHFRTRARFFREAARVLKRGGSLLLSDILFEPGEWPGMWTVPEENRIAGLDEYEALLRAEGFAVTALDDAREKCWAPFCRSLRTWIASRHPEVAGAWEGMIDAMERSVAHYVLASCRRG